MSIATSAPSPDGRGERHASWLELFFDLVFVAAIAALAAQLHDDHSVAGLAFTNAFGATLWLGSLALDESTRPFMWAGAMLFLTTTFAFAPWSRSSDPFDAGHVAERYGLFTIIVLGESIVVTVAGLQTGSSVAAALVAVLGFVVAAAIWWL